MTENLTFIFERRRCWDCGTFYAIETSRVSRTSRCPICATSEVNRANERANKAEHVARGLRGAIKRVSAK